MSRTSGLVQRDSAVTAFGIVNQRGFTEGPQCPGSVEGEGRHGSPSSTAALREVAAGAWEDPGKGEEPVAGVWAGASGVRQGWHLQEGKVTIGRAPNASGSCSPGGQVAGSQGSLLRGITRVSGQARLRAAGRAEKDRLRASLCFLVWRSLRSFGRERWAVGRGRGRRPRPPQRSLPRPGSWRPARACGARICSGGTREGIGAVALEPGRGPPCCAGPSRLLRSWPRLPWDPVCAHAYVRVREHVSR